MKFMEWFVMEKKGVANAYAFFQGTGQEPPWVPTLWRAEIMPKHRFIMWLLVQRKLRTADKMPYVE
ncbi:hypothetical protein, partial [Alkalibacillus haloalkaliphilus]|uniref:hypothetical protein n=1 Tax=Alkalibacillus haloalkaliphilus TaxID=94136 RepID=UPI0029353E31